MLTPRRLVPIRDRVLQAIKGHKLAAGFPFNEFDLDKTYYPYSKLEKLAAKPQGQVWVIGLAFDTDQPKTRTTAGSRNEIPVQVAFQKVVENPQDVDELDNLIDFVEELQEVCRLLVVDEESVDAQGEAIPYQWLRNEALKDENETPYAYMGLREANVFEAYFSAFYLHLLT